MPKNQIPKGRMAKMAVLSGNMSKGRKPKVRMTKRPNEKKFNIVGQKAKCPNSSKGRIINRLVI